MTLAVACMPSLAKYWNIDFVKSVFYRSFQSLLSRVRGTDSSAKSYPSNANVAAFGNDSTAILHGGFGHVDIRPSHSNDARHDQAGIHKMTTFRMERTTEV